MIPFVNFHNPSIQKLGKYLKIGQDIDLQHTNRSSIHSALWNYTVQVNNFFGCKTLVRQSFLLLDLSLFHCARLIYRSVLSVGGVIIREIQQLSPSGTTGFTAPPTGNTLGFSTSFHGGKHVTSRPNYDTTFKWPTLRRGLQIKKNYSNSKGQEIPNPSWELQRLLLFPQERATVPYLY